MQQHKAERVYESQNTYVTMPEDPEFHLCIPREEFRSPLKPTDQPQATHKQKSIWLHSNDWLLAIHLEEEKDDIFNSVTLKINHVSFISGTHSLRLVVMGAKENNSQDPNTWARVKS